MDAIFFGLKRAYHSTLKLGHHVCRRFGSGLTPARLDMLYAIECAPMLEQKQKDLRRRLGLSRPTVSRMLKSLEQLGLVARFPCRDRRTRERARALLNRVLEAVLATDLLKLAVDSSLTMGRFWSPSACLMERDRTEGILRRIRADFGDLSNLYYPWDHPDD